MNDSFDSLRRLYPVPEAPAPITWGDFPGTLAILLHDLLSAPAAGDMLVIGEPPPAWFDYLFRVYHGNVLLISGGVSLGPPPEVETQLAGALFKQRQRVAWQRRGVVEEALGVATRESVSFTVCCLYRPVALSYGDAIRTVRKFGHRPAFIGVGAQAVTVGKLLAAMAAAHRYRHRTVGDAWSMEGGE